MSTTVNNLKENTLTPNDPNVAPTDENLSINEIYQQTSLPSLARGIFPVIQMHGPTAALFNLKTKTGLTDLELLRSEVICENSTSISTGITQEAIQDLRAQYGSEINEIIGKMLRGAANDAENVDTMAFLTANCLTGPNLVRSNPADARLTVYEISQRVQELVLKSNLPKLRTYEAFAILPYSTCASVMASSDYAHPSNDDESSGLFIRKIGQTKYYLNPDPLSTVAYVGLSDLKNSSKSCAVFSPYMSDVIVATDSLTGNDTFHLFNRYAITASALHSVGEEMMHSFTIV